MKQRETTLAPMRELVHFLAVFHRAFLTIQEAAVNHDREAMLLGGGVANALHNVPSRLIHHDPTGSHHIDDRPEAYPCIVRQHAPSRIAALCTHIFSSDGDPEELGLSPDLSDLHLAPPEKFDEYVYILYRACLGIRLMGNHGDIEPLWLTPKPNWYQSADEQGVFYGQLAHLLQPIPAGLVHWDQFDEEAFWRAARQMWGYTPYLYHTRWEMYFARNRWWWLCLMPESVRPWVCHQLSRGLLRFSSGLRRR